MLPTWAIILIIFLIATNVFVWALIIIICEIICYIHDVIQVNRWYKRHKGERKE